MKFLDKIKDLFSDEEEVIETKEIEIDEEDEEKEKEERKLPTFMRNKIEEEERREEARKQREMPLNEENVISDREIVRTRSNNNFSFPMDMDEPIERAASRPTYSSQNVLERERKVAELYNKPELYSKKEEPKPKKFKPTPVISPVYGVLDKNYTKDEVKVSDERTYELQRPSRKVDFETVRNKAFGSLTDDIRNNLCENCELYQEVKITKAADLKLRKDKEEDLLADIKEDITLGDAEDNYFDFGVDYEIPTREDAPSVKITRTKEVEEIKIVNHNDEESVAEKIEVKESPKEDIPEEVEIPTRTSLEDDLIDTKEFEKISTDEETADSILEGLNDISEEDSIENDIFSLMDSIYDEEEK